jgi:DNA polymerase-1
MNLESINPDAKKIFLIDISSMIFRAFYAIRPLTSPSGMPTNAIYGVVSMLLKLIKDHKVQNIICCFDRKEPSFRKDLYEQYKANRTEMPEDLIPQMDHIRRIIDLMGIECIDKDSFEADDLIGSFCHLAQQKKITSIIVSGDKDFCQLVSDSVFMLDTMKDVLTGIDEVLKKYEVQVSQFVDYLAIVGDSSDNVPGVKGLGPKGAAKLLNQFQTLNGIYENIEAITGSAKQKLLDSQQLAFLSQKLVTIKTDIDLQIEDLESFSILKNAKWTELDTVLDELGFKNLKTSLRLALTGQSNNNDIVPGLDINQILNQKIEFIDEDLVQKNTQAKSLEAFLKSIDYKLPVWFLCKETNMLLMQDTSYVECSLLENLTKFFSPLKEKIKISGFNVKQNLHNLCAYNDLNFISCFEIIDDLQLMSYVIDPEDKHDFERVFEKYLNFKPHEERTLVFDAYSFSKIKQKLVSQLHETNQQLVYQNLELPLVKVLFQMEKLGIKLDCDFLSKLESKTQSEILKIQKDIHDLAGEEFNIASPKQLGVILFEKLKLSVIKKTKTGYSTDSDVLGKLKSEHKIISRIEDFRELSKLQSTYIQALPKLVKPDLRLHTTFLQAHTSTGRLSSVDPNLQNIPIKTVRGQEIRKAFVTDPGKLLLSLDYSQIELRILAHYADDAGLIEAFKNDLDIHAATAAEVFSVPLSSVTSDQRRIAKAVNFGIAYGQGAFGLAETLGLSRSEASDIIKKYFAKFSGVKSYIENSVLKAKEAGFAETLFGRKRFIKDLFSKNAMVQKFGERAAINAPIQGTAADIVKKAMIDINKKIKLPMLLQIHDELIFEGLEEEIEFELKEIISIMENVIQLKVPLKVNWAKGASWYLAK